MPYATTKDAIDLYGTLYVLGSVSREASPNKVAFDKALADASSEMDTYLSRNYTVPISPVAPVLLRYCVDIAVYVSSADAGSVTEEKRKRYEDALRWLTLVAKGTVSVPGTTAPSASDGAVPQISGPDRIFSRTKMDGL